MEGSTNPLARLMSTMPRYAITPRKTALVIIDMQYLDAHPGWGLGKKAQTLGLTEAIAPSGVTPICPTDTSGRPMPCRPKD